MSDDLSDWLGEFVNLNPDAIPDEEVAKAKVYKNDLFGDILPALDRRDIKYYSKLSDDQKKDVAIWPLTRWMSSVAGNQVDQLYTVNAVVNTDSIVFGSKKSGNALATNKHKELQWMLLAISGSGRREKHIWPGAPKGSVKSVLEEAILLIFPTLKDDDLELLLQINTRQDLEVFFKENGYDDKSIKELFKGEAKGK